jgi:hypothetical protein
MPPIKKSGLTESEQLLLNVLYDLDFGRVEDLHIREGEPIFEPMPRVVATRRLGGPAPVGGVLARDFELKRHHLDLFELIRRIREGIILVLHVHHGLPVAADIEWSASGGRT